jgi:FtsZ-binding cell division protein ZapB
LTSDFERIKILEGKISQIVEYIRKLTEENERLKQQIRDLKAEKKNYAAKIDTAEKLDETLKKFEKEREVLKEKIETIIGQIDQLGI